VINSTSPEAALRPASEGASGRTHAFLYSPIGGFSEGAVERVSDRSEDRGSPPGQGVPAGNAVRRPGGRGLHEPGLLAGRRLPADDHAGEGDDDGDVDECAGGQALLGAGRRKDRIRSCQGQREGLYGPRGVVSGTGRDVVPAGQAQQADRDVAAGGHDPWRLPGADLEFVFSERLVAHPMKAVFDAPVALHPGRERGRWRDFVSGGGDQVDDTC